MAYDASQMRVVLFGGWDGEEYLDDTCHKANRALTETSVSPLLHAIYNVTVWRHFCRDQRCQDVLADFLSNWQAMAGLALLKEAKWQVPGSLLGAAVAGGFAVFVVGKIMVFWKRLQSSGTIDMSNAIGQQGSVYLTIRAGGTGKVQVNVQERFKVLDAVCADGEELKSGVRITVVDLNDDNTLIVRKL